MTPEFSNTEELSKPAEAPAVEAPAVEAEKAETPAVESVDDFVFVKMPSGAIVPVPKSSVQTVEETVKQDAAHKFSEPIPEAQFYVHTANGDVMRVNESDLPEGHGSNAPFGHWVKDGKVHTVIGVYPVESVIG